MALGQASHQGEQLYKNQYWDLGPGEKKWRGGEETQTSQVEEQALETTVRKSDRGKMTTMQHRGHYN